MTNIIKRIKIYYLIKIKFYGFIINDFYELIAL